MGVVYDAHFFMHPAWVNTRWYKKIRNPNCYRPNDSTINQLNLTTHF